jgi:hypothetical protein
VSIELAPCLYDRYIVTSSSYSMNTLRPTYALLSNILYLKIKSLRISRFHKEMQRKNRTITKLFLSPTFPIFIRLLFCITNSGKSLWTDVLRFTDPKVGNALRSLDFTSNMIDTPPKRPSHVYIVVALYHQI